MSLDFIISTASEGKRLERSMVRTIVRSCDVFVVRVAGNDNANH